MTLSRRCLIGAAGLAILPLPGCDRLLGRSSEPRFHFTDITGAEFARRLELPDADGRTRSLADWKGKVIVVFFGYTQCPDFCPTTLTELAQVKKDLGAAGRRVEVLFVTVDPERDTPQVMKSYVSNFGPDVVGLRGSPEQTAEAAKEFKVFYAKVPGKTPGSYTMDHSAASFVFDTQGKVRLYVPYGADQKAFEQDLSQLLSAA
ncbi:MAG TPA: SCO family protein [Caldimonas sp.]|nr:SCO family protein [Caldimonas sp.]